DGGGRGIEAALVIALAKGFLMPTARAGLTPTAVMVRLHARVISLMEDTRAGGLLYATIEAATGTVNYTRWGVSPTVLVRNASTGVVSSVAERQTTATHETSEVALLEGRCSM